MTSDRRQTALSPAERQSRQSWRRARAVSVVARQRLRGRSERHRKRKQQPLRSRLQRRLRRRRPRQTRPRPKSSRKKGTSGAAKGTKNWRRLWVKKFIHTVFDSAITKTGIRTG